MNAVDTIAPGRDILSSSPRPDGVALGARVASAHVRGEMSDSPDQQVLFLVVGLSKALTCAIACELERDLPGATVAVHEDMAMDLLPSAMISHRSLASYRNDPREPGGGAIIYAPSPRELDDVGKTSAEIQHVSEQVLVAKPELWLDCTQELGGLNPRERQNVINVLRGIAAAQILTTGLEMFGEFVERLDLAHASMEVERALDRALPALRIPYDAGRFKKPGARGRLPSVETWADRFRELQALADDALSLRRDGAPLNRAQLAQRLQELSAEGAVTEDERDALAALIADARIEPGKWRPAQATAAELRWSAVERLVKTSKRKAQQALGDATLALFREKMPDELGGDEKAVLTAMSPDTDAADDEERGFFFRQRTSIADYSKPLLKRWEQYVFRKTEQHADLALGLFIAIADLVEGTEAQLRNPLVYVRLQGADRSKFWDTHNLDLCRFMRDRYRGLPEVFRRAGVELDWGMCWTGNWGTGGSPARGSKLAREFKFDIFLLDAEGGPADDGQGARRKWLAETAKAALSTTQMIWSMPADSVASSYSENMEEVANLEGERALLASGRFSRAQDQDRSTDGRLSLERRTTFQDANGRPDGILVNPNDARTRAGAAFEQGLAELRGDILPEADAQAIEAAYLAFASSYSDAVRALVGADGLGLADPALLRQSAAYGELLALLRRHARKDDCRRALWQPLLSVGIAFSDDRPPVAICTPWHPFKLAAKAAKARHLADALARVLGGTAADVRTFSRTVARTVADGWYPAVALSPATPKPYLLSETDQYADFGLMEAPTVDQGAADAFDGYSEQAARELLGVADEYLEIQPHERANFSVVLYNADNRGLPSHLASTLAAKVEQEKDLRCDLVLTHSDQRRLRQIYAEQNVAISARLDGTMASEAAQTFLSRLRVGFIDLGGLGKSDQSVQAADLVFLHDVIARGAKTAWRRVPEPPGGWLPFEVNAPDGETRRRPFEKGTRKTESLLVPAERPLEVQQYLDLMRDFHQDYREVADGHYVPVREIDFDESGVGLILDQAHRVARWVVTYDAIADLHLFRSNNVEIIRYVPRPDRDHNLVVSTRQPGAMLLAKLSEEIGRVLSAGYKKAHALARVCIENASAISGRVVLRAARLENNALELLGLVLSRQVVLDSVAPGSVPVCWLLLDDFADRLGHKGRKADILVVCLSASDGVPVVDLMVVESKFTSQDGEGAAMAESMDQMRASTTDLRSRVIGEGDVLNRPTWLRRLADLLLEHGSFPGPVAGRDPGEWARIIRSEEASLKIVGLSLVFVHDRLDGVPEPLVGSSPEQRQFTFNRDQVAEGLRTIQAAGAAQS